VRVRVRKMIEEKLKKRIYTADEFWAEIEKFLRKHGYSPIREEIEAVAPWEESIKGANMTAEEVFYTLAFFIHEAVEHEELKRIVGILPPHDMAILVDKYPRAHWRARKLQLDWYKEKGLVFPPYFREELQKLRSYKKLGLRVPPTTEPAFEELKEYLKEDPKTFLKVIDDMKEGKNRKEPWEMTREEWLKQTEGVRGIDSIIITLPTGEKKFTPRGTATIEPEEAAWMLKEIAFRTHKEMIEQALEEGKFVPKEVLKDYPELFEKVKEKEELFRVEGITAPPEVAPPVKPPEVPIPEELTREMEELEKEVETEKEIIKGELIETEEE